MWDGGNPLKTVHPGSQKAILSRLPIQFHIIFFIPEGEQAGPGLQENVTGSVSRLYDNDFRIISRSVNGADTILFDYDQDRLTSTASATYTYTDNGELLTKTEGTQVTQYKYDVLGNLLSVTLPSGNLIEYVIDARNRRTGKKVDGVLQKSCQNPTKTPLLLYPLFVRGGKVYKKESDKKWAH